MIRLYILDVTAGGKKAAIVSKHRQWAYSVTYIKSAGNSNQYTALLWHFGGGGGGCLRAWWLCPHIFMYTSADSTYIYMRSCGFSRVWWKRIEIRTGHPRAPSSRSSAAICRARVSHLAKYAFHANSSTLSLCSRGFDK